MEARKHAVVTGASSGIGATLARELAAHGWSLTLVARREALLHGLAAELGALGARTHVVARDLGDLSRATDWLAGAEAALGPIDVLVNNAGVQIIDPTVDVAPEDGEALLRLDLLAPPRLTQAARPALFARGAGTIVDVASMAALAPTPGMFHYNAAKAGLAAASEALRGELRGTGVHVVTVYPGVIDTTAMAIAGIAKYGASSRVIAWTPRGREDVLATLVRRAIERRRARVISPRSGVLARWGPAATRWLLDRFTPPRS
ncbi:MAG: hypothetical protein NVS3B10_16760 [Polyangiales bacterium]